LNGDAGRAASSGAGARSDLDAIAGACMTGRAGTAATGSTGAAATASSDAGQHHHAAADATTIHAAGHQGMRGGCDTAACKGSRR